MMGLSRRDSIGLLPLRLITQAPLGSFTSPSFEVSQ
jgi:hypothetical protein